MSQLNMVNKAETNTALDPRGPSKTAKLTLRQQLESPAFFDAVKRSLPRHLKPDRFLRVALTAITRTPRLAECDQASFFNALLSLSQYGLEPDGRRAHLIPFENRKRGCIECQLIVDWKGIAELVMRSGLVSNLHADVVRDGDVFEYNMGRVTRHVPWFVRRDADKPAAPGDVFAVYAFAEFRDGTTKADVMDIAEVEEIRRRSRAGQSGPWVTDWTEMAKKTVFRRLSKWLPLSAEVMDAAESGDEPIMVGPAPQAATGPAQATTLAAMLRPVQHIDAGALEPDVEYGDESRVPAPSPADQPAQAKNEGRDKVVSDLKMRLLDLDVPESRLWKYAVEGKHVPEGVDDIWVLPTATLAKLLHAVPALVGAKGGAK